MHIISWIMLIAGPLIPIVARLEGKKLEQWPVFIMLAGVVGVFSHSVLASLDERVSKTEKRGTDMPESPDEAEGS
jgi:hypothetical protein